MSDSRDAALTLSCACLKAAPRHTRRVAPVLLHFVLLTALLVSLVWAPPGAVAATWPDGVAKVEVSAERIAGQNRYDTAVAIAKKAYPGWAGVRHVIVASGEDRAAADPLAAASLSWAYDAPLLLVKASDTPAVVESALRDMVSVNTTVTVHVVGGSRSVPWARIKEMRAIVGRGRIEQPWPNGTRYDLARGIALRVRDIAAQTGRTRPGTVFVANGADANTFFDALSLSAVSAARGVPILLVARDSVPGPTASALRSLAATDVVVAGGTATVSKTTASAVRASARWSGANRYATSAEIARAAVKRGLLGTADVALVAKLPDAVTGAALMGRLGGPLLLTETRNISQDPARVLGGAYGPVGRCLVLGGSHSVSKSVMSELAGAPAAPLFLSPDSRTAKKGRVKTRLGVNTTTVALYAGTKLVGTRTAVPFATVDFGAMEMPKDGGTLKLVAGNPDGKSGSSTKTIRRLSYPASTSIVIDKSDFRLYWVKNDVLVRAYPIAIGRDGMETPPALWKILAKYHTSPTSVYGPRKMRLFRKSGSRYVYTAYGIHGTNQEWVIGTKASHGCIRMYNKDVLELFPQVPLGTLVQTRQ
ncbi:MAG: cell wall-binding repeat-containing protein [Actinomycetota bacterium]|nr:cell wall-binding repeat-containing protein [Actinomycetota bacterium]